MTPIDSFKAQLEEFATNNVTAMEGHIQLTFAERENLKLMFQKLTGADRVQALKLAQDRGLDVTSWV